MKNYANFYHFLNSLPLKILRIGVFIFFAFLLFIKLSEGMISIQALKFPLFFLLFFSILEIFFKFKIARIHPLISAQNNHESIFQSFTLLALDSSLSGKTSKIIKELLKKDAINFILQKSNIVKKEIPLNDISKDELLNNAFNLVKEINGKFVTTMDVFSAYLLIVEKQNNLLFSKKLKREEFLQILLWARENYSNEENPKLIRVNFWGEGIGEAFVSGWTLETKKYTRSLTEETLRKKPILVGRVSEQQAIVEILSKTEKNNIILIGEPGVGINTLIEILALESYTGKLKGRLGHIKIFELLVGSLLAGAQTQADLQSRLEEIIQEITHSGDIIIYIPEVQNIFGGSAFHIDLSGTLLPFLKEGKLKIIASVTAKNYKLFVEPLSRVLDVFETVKIDQPDTNLALKMLLGKAQYIEEKNKVSLTYRSILTSLNMASRYMQEKVLPGSAILLLNDTANSVYLTGKKIIEEEDVIKKIEDKIKFSISAPKAEEKELLLHLEESLHKRIIGQEKAVFAISEAIRRLRSGLTVSNKPISFLFLGPTGVGKTETAKAISDIYFGGESKMLRFDMSEYTTGEGVKRLLGAAPGEGEDRGELTDKILDNPSSLILLDEFEKANPQILDLFLQVFEDGRLTDNKGKTVSFINSIIIATSNAASEFIREEIEKGEIVDKPFQARLLSFLQINGIFKPELLNRFDDVIVFTPLGEKEIFEVIKLMLNKLSQKLQEQDIAVSFDEKVIAKIEREGFDKQFGARPIRRFIQDKIEDLLAQKMLKDEIKRGSKVYFSIDETSNIIIVSS